LTTAALATKENAVFIGFAIITYDVIYGDRGWRPRWPAVAHLVLCLVYIAVRAPFGSPYDVASSIERLPLNTAYYAAVSIFALPDNYGYLSSAPAWAAAPLFPIAVMACAGLGVAVLVIVGWRTPAARLVSDHMRRFMMFAVLWTLLAIAPVILTATGRTAYLASIGVAWTFAAAFAGLAVRSRRTRAILVVALLAVLVANATVLANRALWWRRAAAAVGEVFTQLDYELREPPASHAICVVGLPDHLRHAYAFRNALPAAFEVTYPHHDVRGFVDSDYAAADTDRAVPGRECDGAVVYTYSAAEGLLRHR
jgi:hypothetical protein